LPHCAQSTAILNLYPSLPEFTQTWTAESPQFPPSGWPTRREELTGDPAQCLFANRNTAPFGASYRKALDLIFGNLDVTRAQTQFSFHSGFGHRNGGSGLTYPYGTYRGCGADFVSMIDGGLTFRGSSRSAWCAAQTSQSPNAAPGSTAWPSASAVSLAAATSPRIRSARSRFVAARCNARTRASSCLICSARCARSAAIRSASAFSAARPLTASRSEVTVGRTTHTGTACRRM